MSRRFVLCGHCQWSQHGVRSNERCNCQCHPYQSKNKKKRGSFRHASGRSRVVVQLIERDGDLCCWCDEKFTPSWPPTVEHWIPKSKGGSNAITNLRLACSWCNHKRGDMDVGVFREWLKTNLVPRSHRRNRQAEARFPKRGR